MNVDANQIKIPPQFEQPHNRNYPSEKTTSSKWVQSPSCTSSSDSEAITNQHHCFYPSCPPPNITLYGDSAINRFRNEDEKRTLNINYRNDVQNDIEDGDRNNIVSWMFQACSQLDASDSAIFLSVKIFDYLLSNVQISRDSLQLYASCAILIAIKSEDIGSMQILERLCPLTRNINDQELLDLEFEIFKIVDYNILFATAYVFLMYYLSKYKDTNRDLLFNVARFFTVAGIAEDTCFKYGCETISVAAMIFALKIMNKPITFIEDFSKFPKLNECLGDMLNSARNIFIDDISNDYRPFFLAIETYIKKFFFENNIDKENNDFISKLNVNAKL